MMINHFNDALERAKHVQRDAQKLLDLELMVGNYEVDEVSILCGSPVLLQTLVNHCTSLGYDHFNRVESDRMKRKDTLRQRKFDVRFEFLRAPGASWRIEAMCVLGGHAPLHSQHIAVYGDPCVVHASFKCQDEEGLGKAERELHKIGSALPFCASYQNSYGEFSYWKVGRYYLKPRVNLRDDLRG